MQQDKMAKVAAGMNKKMSITSTSVTEEVKKKEVPAGATILSKTVRTEVEKIENGWLLTKNYDVKFKEKNKEYNDYAYYSKRWYSEEEPLQEVEELEKALADSFEEE